MRKLALILSTTLLLWSCSQPAGPSSTSADNKPAAPGSHKQLPAFELAKLDGGTMKSTDLKGKVAVVDFWATWCENCIPEVPNYNAIREKYKDKGVEVIGITVLSGTAKEITGKVAELKLDMKYPVLVGDDKIEEGFGGNIGYPTTYLIAQDGTIYKRYLGAPPDKKEKIEKDIETLLSNQGT